MDLTSLFDDLARSDQKPTTRVLDRELVAAPAAVAERLGVPAGTQVLHLDRLRCAREEPLAVMRNWLPADLAPGAHRRGAGDPRAVRADARHRRAPAHRHPADRRPRATARRPGCSRCARARRC
jgi:hypothetical protein